MSDKIVISMSDIVRQMRLHDGEGRGWIYYYRMLENTNVDQDDNRQPLKDIKDKNKKPFLLKLWELACETALPCDMISTRIKYDRMSLRINNEVIIHVDPINMVVAENKYTFTTFFITSDEYYACKKQLDLYSHGKV